MTPHEELMKVAEEMKCPKCGQQRCGHTLITEEQSEDTRLLNWCEANSVGVYFRYASRRISGPDLRGSIRNAMAARPAGEPKTRQPNYDTSKGEGCDECGNTHGDSHSTHCSRGTRPVSKQQCQVCGELLPGGVEHLHTAAPPQGDAATDDEIDHMDTVRKIMATTVDGRAAKVMQGLAVDYLRLRASEKALREKADNWKTDLDRVAAVVYPHKTDRFTYSVEFMIQEITALRAERGMLRRALVEARYVIDNMPWQGRDYKPILSTVDAALAAQPAEEKKPER